MKGIEQVRTFVNREQDVAVRRECYRSDVLAVLEWKRAGFIADQFPSSQTLGRHLMSYTDAVAWGKRRSGLLT